jgi:ribosome-associated protein
MKMTDDDINWDEYYGGPSRSTQRREALDILALAKELAALPAGDLDLVPLNESLRRQVDEARRITQQVAHKRQVQYLAKHLRKYQEDIPAIRLAVDAPKLEKRRATAQLHHAEVWRDRLIAEGDDAINALLLEHPEADRQQLRQLVRQANVELKAGKPPAASRQIFKIVRDLLN